MEVVVTVVLEQAESGSPGYGAPRTESWGSVNVAPKD